MRNLSWWHRTILGARVFLGLVFFVSGVIGLLHLAPLPTTTPAAAGFVRALSQTGYLFAALYLVESLCGMLLVLGLLVPLCLVLLAPVVVNILLYTAMLDQAGLPIGIVLVIVELLLAWAYRGAFLGLFQVRAEPS